MAHLELRRRCRTSMANRRTRFGSAGGSPNGLDPFASLLGSIGSWCTCRRLPPWQRWMPSQPVLRSS
eukprot:11315066-Alexandrium_andersonii.AAC.1